MRQQQESPALKGRGLSVAISPASDGSEDTASAAREQAARALRFHREARQIDGASAHAALSLAAHYSAFGGGR